MLFVNLPTPNVETGLEVPTLLCSTTICGMVLKNLCSGFDQAAVQLVPCGSNDLLLVFLWFAVVY